MIRRVQFSDVVRQLLLGRRTNVDMAYTWESVGLPERHLGLLEIARLGMLPSSSEYTFPLALTDGNGLKGLAVIRTRSGIRAWELAHMYFGKDVVQEQCLELLESCVIHIGQKGGERLFLRLEEGNSLERAAQLSGFHRICSESVYQFDEFGDVARQLPYINMRPPSSDADRYNLFRLYNSVVPSAVRSVLGLTIDQWSSAQDYSSGHIRSYVWGRYGEFRSWLRVAERQGKIRLEIMLHPEEHAISHVVCMSAMQLVNSRTAMWVVPDYQPIVASALEQIGWSEIGRYSMFVKSVAKESGQVVESLVRA